MSRLRFTSLGVFDFDKMLPRTAVTLEVYRAARNAAGISLSVMAARTHYSKPYLSMVETGRRAATADVVSAHDRVLGIGKLGDDVNRRDFFTVSGLVAGNAKVATELAASIAGNDSGALATVQTTHGTDLAVATLADRGTVEHLRRWLDDGDNPVLRVNAAGILAKIPGQGEASRVTAALGRDPDVCCRRALAQRRQVMGHS